MPSPEIVQKALEQIRKRPANHDYFFSKLDSPEWIKPLRDAGLFTEPPTPIRDADNINFPFWPESRYLARVASKDPVSVLETIESIPTTDNVRVLEDYAEAGLAMPGPLANRLAAKLLKWIERQSHLYFLLPEQLAKLGNHLAESGEAETALQLFRALLRIDTLGKNGDQPLPRFSVWSYERILDSELQTLLASDGLHLLELLCDLLASAVSDKEDKYTYIWRPAIEDHSQNHRHGDIRDSLIKAVRDSANTLCEPSLDCENVLRILSQYPHQIFRRLVLQFLATHCERLPNQARDTVLTQGTFSELTLRHEYMLLLRNVLPNMNASDQEIIAGWIAAGPDADSLDSDPKTQISQKKYWQARWLAALDASIPSSWLARFADLMDLAKTIEHADFVSYTTSWSGPNSPLSDDEIQQMPISALAEYLKSWQSPGRWESPTPEGLGRILQAVAAKNPSRYISSLQMFIGVDATYARSLVKGLRDAIENISELDWAKVLDYLSWVVSIKDEVVANESSMHGKDPHWGWSRKAVADLLGKSFQKDHLPKSLRRKAWDVLLPLTDDLDPRQEDESTKMDPATRSINSVRGEAMHAVIQYALWVYRTQPSDSKQSAGFDSMPEVKNVLERHLDTTYDPSATIRAIYGQHFPWLALIDREWAIAHRTAVFPGQAVDKRLHAAAWNTYIVFCQPYNEMLSVLNAEYEEAVESAAEVPFGDYDLSDPRERLAQHIVVFLGRGLIPAEEAQSLGHRFLRNAPENMASYMIRFVGHSLREKGAVPSEVLQRFKIFWDTFYAWTNQESIPNNSALKAFGTWFSCDRFDYVWSSRIVLEILKRGHGIENDYDIASVLKKHSSEHPLVSVIVLAALIRSDLRDWAVHTWKDDARAILEIALRYEDSANEARNVIHELGARGFLELRELL